MDLSHYDVLLVNSSGGKDSQAMLDFLAEMAQQQGMSERVVVVHADLGRVEHPGTRALAEEQARSYGFRFEVVSRDRDLLHQIEHERRKFPDAARRYCTSDQKTSQVAKLITALGKEHRHNDGSPVRILNCLGMRAQESPARAKKPVFGVERSNRNVHVDRWLPIHAWHEYEVWARIENSGVRHHPAYDAGYPRLSCVFCILSSKSALMLGARMYPELAEEYVRIETAIGHTFRHGLSMAQIVEDAQTSDLASIDSWNA